MSKNTCRSLLLVIVTFVALSQIMIIKGINSTDITKTDDSVFKGLRDTQLATIFNAMRIDFASAHTDFSTNLSVEVASVGDYDEEKMRAFDSFIQDQLTDSQKKLKAAADTALSSYNTFLKDQGRFVVGKTDDSAQQIIDMINYLCTYFENKIVQYKDTLMSGETVAELSAKLAAQIDLFNIQRKEDFNAQQAIDEVIITHTEWENFLKNLDNFGPILGEKLLDGLAKTMEEQLVKIGENAAKLLGELTTDLTDLIKKEASALLEKMGKDLTPKIEEMLKKALPKIESFLKLVGTKLENATMTLLFDLLKKFLQAQMKPEHDFAKVSVRTGNGICDDEKLFISIRSSKAAQVLKNTFGISVPLKMATMSSGGGTRAMLGYIGFIVALEKAGLWDAILYNATASGSSLLAMPYSHANILGAVNTMEEYRDALIKGNVMAANPPGISGAMLLGAVDWFIKEFAYGLPFSSSDLAGLFYGNFSILEDDPTGARISDISQGILSANIPLPLCSAVFYKDNQRINDAKQVIKEEEEAAAKKAAEEKAAADKTGADTAEKPDEDEDDVDIDIDKALSEVAKNEAKKEDEKLSPDSRAGIVKAQAISAKTTRYNWFEWNPFEAGGKAVGFVPVYALGAEFKDGKPIVDADEKTIVGIPEYPLYNFLGTMMSFYAASLNDAIDKISDALPDPSFDFLGRTVKIPVTDWIGTFLDAQGFDISETRLLAPQYFNFSKGLSSSSLNAEEKLEIMDSSLDFNMPFPLLMDNPDRAMDIIFMFHDEPGIESIFADAILYFKREEIKYPAEFDNVTTESLASKSMTVFNDPRNSDYQDGVPTFIYVPFLNCPAYAELYNFTYSGAQITNISNLVETVFTSQINEITEVMQLLAVRKGDTELRDKSVSAQGLSVKKADLESKAHTAHKRGFMDRVYRNHKEQQENFLHSLNWQPAKRFKAA